jgi:hypothetical protein
LLDTDNQYGLTQLGIYLSWHAALITVPVDEVLAMATGRRSTLSDFRQDMAAAIQPGVEERRRSFDNNHRYRPHD